MSDDPINTASKRHIVVPTETMAYMEVHERVRRTDGHAPETWLQALMEAAPNADPEESQEEKQKLIGAVLDGIEQLTDRDRELIELIIYERLSLRKAAERLGVTHPTVAAWRDEAYSNLAAILADHPIIKDRYGI